MELGRGIELLSTKYYIIGGQRLVRISCGNEALGTEVWQFGIDYFIVIFNYISAVLLREPPS